MNRYALVVGIGQYTSERLTTLKRARADAQAIHDLLHEYGDFKEIHLLQDADASYERLVERLEYVLLEQGDKSEVLIYFSGHGLTAGANRFEQQGHLTTYDCVARPSSKDFWLVEKSISFQFLSGLIAESNLAGLAVFLDCCHSERFIEQMLVGKGLGDSLFNRQYFLSMACRGYEYAYENKGEPNSAYTMALLKALRDETAGKISVVKAHEAAKDRLTGQEAISLSYGSDFVVVDYRGQVPIDRTVSEECPYQGLRAFQPETARFFFGREEEKRLLWERLQRSNFVAVLGPSGIGKSSVVRAGLAKRLEDEGWQVLTMMPGSDPLGRLRAEVERFLAKAEVSAGGRRRLVGALEQDGLLAMAMAWAVELPGMRVLLLVDQFEEVFTQCAADKRDCFIRALVAVGQAQTSLAVVMTMRSDFYNEWLVTRQPSVMVSDYSVPLLPLRGEDCENLKAAIVEPARLQGYEIESELLELLLEDVTAEENSLPLLEFALEALWKDRDTEKRVLTVAAYRQMEKLTGALNRQAEKVFLQMREPEQVWAKRICLQLVWIGRDGRDTRQRQQKETLLAMAGKDGGKQQIVVDVIQDLVDGRLLVSGGDEGEAYVDVAHEALLDGWRRFVGWRQEDREQRRLEQRLQNAFEEWIEKEKKNNYLLSGGLLAELRERKEAIKAALADGRPELMRYFSLSDEREQEKVAALEQALAKADIQAASRKVRDKLLFTPAQTVAATVSAISLVGKSQADFDGQVVYSSQDALHRAWFTIRERLKLEGHSGPVSPVAFSPSGDYIASGSNDRTLRLWDLEGNAIGQPFEGHSDWVLSVAFSPRGDCIVSSGNDRTLRLWDLEGNAISQPFEGHSDWVLSVAFSPRGDRIVLGSSDRTLRLWDLEGNVIGQPFEGHSNWVGSVAFSPKGDRVVSSSGDSTLRLWDLEGNAIGQPFEGHRGSVWSVAFSPRGDRIVSGGNDNTLRLWDLEGNVIGQPFEGHSDWVSSVAFSPQGDLIVSGSHDETLRLWDLEGNVIGQPFEGHSDWVGSVTFSPKGDRVVSSSGDSTLRLWNLEGNAISKPFEGHSDMVNSVVFSPQGDLIVSGSHDETLRLWDLEGNAIGQPFEGHGGLINSVVFSPKGDLIVSGSDDGTLRLWDLEGNAIGQPFEGHSGFVRSVVFSPKEDLIVSGSHDGTLRLWDLEGNAIGQPFEAYRGSVWSVAFSPKGDLIVSGSDDGTLRLWDLEGNAIGQPFEGHSGFVNSVAFSPKGDRIASGSSDSTLRLWDLEGNAIGQPFEGHSDGASSVAFSPQGDWIVSGSGDSTLRLWLVGTWEDELHHCCNLLMRHTALTLPQDETARKACEVCEQVWTRQQSAQFAVAQGSALARRGDVEGAVEKFERAKGLDPTLEINSVGRARELVEWAIS